MQKQTSSTQHVTIEGPPQRVLAFVSNASLWPQWIAEVVEVSNAPAELTAQSTCDVVFDIGGRRLPATCQVKSLLPEQRLEKQQNAGIIKLKDILEGRA